MEAKQISIDPKERTVEIFVDDVTINELKTILRQFKGMSDYEFIVHNPNQTTDLIDVYKANVLIDNLYKTNGEGRL